MALPAPKPSIDTCNACGKLFPRISMRLCAHCALVEEHRFQLVREHLTEHAGSAVADIAAATGVSTGDIREFMESGRLVTTGELTACICGGVGERCRFCRSRLSSSFRQLEQSMRSNQTLPDPDETAPRTHYVRRIRRVGGDA